MTSPRALIQISLDALKHNLTIIKSHTTAKVMAVVKTNAYGHGLVPCAKALVQADALAVRDIHEAMILRNHGIPNPICLLEGCFFSEEWRAAAANGFWPVVCDAIQLQSLLRCELPKKMGVWIKLDAGMNRLGFHLSEAQRVSRQIERAPNLEILGYVGHFSRADERKHPITQTQNTKFMKAIEGLPGWRSTANSGALFAFPETHGDWVRPGIALYGISPYPHQTGKQLRLLPVMTVRARLMSIRHVLSNETVGYGGTWRAPSEGALIGLVSFGYGDGYPRSAPNGTPVLLNGQKVPIVGRISMNMLAVNLCAQPFAKVGDPVILWGDGLPIEEVAGYAQTSAYELVCRLGEQTPREWLNSSSSTINARGARVQ